MKSVRIRSFCDPYSVRMQESRGQRNSKYGHFSRIKEHETLTHFRSLPLSIPPENIRKPEVFQCFQWLEKMNIGRKFIKRSSSRFFLKLVKYLRAAIFQKTCKWETSVFNPFLNNISILYQPLKTPEN